MKAMEQVPEPLKDLIDDYLNGLLDESRTQELEALLRGDATARSYFVRYARLHTDLVLDTRARRAGDRALGALTQVAPRPSLLRGWFSLTRLAVAATVLLTAGAGWWLWTRPSVHAAPEPAVAWLVNAQNCQWQDTEPAGPMRAGTVLRIERGLAEVRFASGARVVLEGPARLELLSGNSARLLRGRLTARVPEPARGFEVLSPQGKVIDLGTEFGVSVADDGAADVFVFEGQVNASAAGRSVSVLRNQAAHIAGGAVKLNEGSAEQQSRGYTRTIVAPPVIVPRMRTFNFHQATPDSLRDKAGKGIGLTYRLPGTGRRLSAHDENLHLDTVKGQLELTTTNSDINAQYKLDHGEYLGVRLSDLGFSGGEDFAVSMSIPEMPALAFIGQFGLYAGTASDRNIRGGIFSHKPGQYTQNLVNNGRGLDTDSHFVGLFSPGDNLRLTLRRIANKYTLTVENRTTGKATTLATRPPRFLDGERDLYVGLFGANTRSNVRKALVIKEFHVTVWTVHP